MYLSFLYLTGTKMLSLMLTDRVDYKRILSNTVYIFQWDFIHNSNGWLSFYWSNMWLGSNKKGTLIVWFCELKKQASQIFCSSKPILFLIFFK